MYCIEDIVGLRMHNDRDEYKKKIMTTLQFFILKVSETCYSRAISH